MEAGALRAPAALNRISVTAPLLRLRSDEQLVALFRAGNDAAFSVIHDRYRQRLFAYSRQMLGGSRQDAEDALQDVFLRAYSSLRANDRPLSLRAWLYRVAHNRCIDHLRQPAPPAADLFDTSRKPLHDPIDEAERREDLRQLIEDVRRLPEQQRSALLMREMDGLSYAELARRSASRCRPSSRCSSARGSGSSRPSRRATPPARRSASTSPTPSTAACARAASPAATCATATAASSTAPSCARVRQGLARLSPGGPGPLAAALKLLGLGGAGSAGAASAGGGAAAGGGAIAAAAAARRRRSPRSSAARRSTAGGAVEVARQIVEAVGEQQRRCDSARPRRRRRRDPAARRRPASPRGTTAARRGGSAAARAAHGAAIRPIRASARELDAQAAPTPTRPAARRAAGRRRPQRRADRRRGGADEETGFGHGVDGLTPRSGDARRSSTADRSGDRRHAPATAHATPSGARARERASRSAASAPPGRRRRRAGSCAGSGRRRPSRCSIAVRAEHRSASTATPPPRPRDAARAPRRRSGLFTIVAVHSTRARPGARRLPHVALRRRARRVRDALRLSRAMTFKSAVAGLPLGGGKGIILAPDPAVARPPRPARRRAARLRRHRRRRSAAPTSRPRTSARRRATWRSSRRSTSHVTGLSRRRGGSGDPSPWTALGVEAAIGVCCERVFGTPSLSGRTIAIAGLGHVGARVAKLCADGGATLLVADIDRAQARARRRPRRALDRARRGARGARPTCSSPCALGGAARPRERRRGCGAPIVAGAANNQLADDDVADLLAERGVLWAPDFVVNAGGIINISVELEPAGYDPRRARERVRGIGDTLRRIFDDAQARGGDAADGGDGARARERLARRRPPSVDARLTSHAPAAARPAAATAAAPRRPAAGPPRRACRGARRASRSRRGAGSRARRPRRGRAARRSSRSPSASAATQPPLAVGRWAR